MARQLTLIEEPSTWRLDDHTREVGRRGIASARAALAAHRPDDQRDDHPDDHRDDRPERSHAA